MPIINATSLEEYLTCFLDASYQRHQVSSSSETKLYLQKFLLYLTHSENLFKKINTFTEYSALNQETDSITLRRYHALQQPTAALRNIHLKDLGDYCLFMLGFFYEHLRQKGESSPIYYQTIGASSYADLSSSIPKREDKQVFQELANNFWDFGVIIGDLHLAQLNQPEKFLSLYQKWLLTKDSRFAQLLQINPLIPLEEREN